MKTCPFCAEDIQDAATVCKHCGRELEAPRATVAQNAVQLGCLGLVVLAVFAFGAAWCNPNHQDAAVSEWGRPQPIARAQFGDAWPFIVDRGQLRCDLGNHVVFMANGHTYAINGSAKGAAARNGYADSAEVIAITAAGAPADVRPVIEAGLQLCR